MKSSREMKQKEVEKSVPWREREKRPEKEWRANRRTSKRLEYKMSSKWQKWGLAVTFRYLLLTSLQSPFKHECLTWIASHPTDVVFDGLSTLTFALRRAEFCWERGGEDEEVERKEEGQRERNILESLSGQYSIWM